MRISSKQGEKLSQAQFTEMGTGLGRMMVVIVDCSFEADGVEGAVNVVFCKSITDQLNKSDIFGTIV